MQRLIIGWIVSRTKRMRRVSKDTVFSDTCHLRFPMGELLWESFWDIWIWDKSESVMRTETCSHPTGPCGVPAAKRVQG